MSTNENQSPGVAPAPKTPLTFEQLVNQEDYRNADQMAGLGEGWHARDAEVEALQSALKQIQNMTVEIDGSYPWVADLVARIDEIATAALRPELFAASRQTADAGEQKPVAWKVNMKNGYQFSIRTDFNTAESEAELLGTKPIPLYAHPAPRLSEPPAVVETGWIPVGEQAPPADKAVLTWRGNAWPPYAAIGTEETSGGCNGEYAVTHWQRIVPPAPPAGKDETPK